MKHAAEGCAWFTSSTASSSWAAVLVSPAPAPAQHRPPSGSGRLLPTPRALAASQPLVRSSSLTRSKVTTQAAEDQHERPNALKHRISSLPRVALAPLHAFLSALGTPEDDGSMVSCGRLGAGGPARPGPLSVLCVLHLEARC